MIDQRIKNPFGVILKDVILRKFDDKEPMSILPQVAEFSLYQSIFSPILKAQLVIYDAVNLLNNYPLIGEETIEVLIDQQGTTNKTDQVSVTLKFIIAAVTNLEFGINARDQSYIIELHSYESFQNAKTKVSKSYKSADTKAYVEDILKTYLKSEKDLYIPQYTMKDAVERVFVVPNLRPFAAINWMARMTTPSNPDQYHNYFFYETLFEQGSRFVFKPFQLLTWMDTEDEEAAYKQSERKPFFYISNYELIKGSPQAMQSLMRNDFTEERLVINLKINKRHSVLEKIIGGYFENELVEINLDQKTHEITKTKVTDPWKHLYFKKYYNTEPYINNIINESEDKESSGRVKYVMFNYEKMSDPMFRNRWGKQEISKLATSQVDLSVDIHTNVKIVPGDLIYIEMPEMHGFEQSRQDRYLRGHYHITETKTIIRTTGESAMLIRVNKDSYFSPIADKSSLGLEGKK